MEVFLHLVNPWINYICTIIKPFKKSPKQSTHPTKNSLRNRNPSLLRLYLPILINPFLTNHKLFIIRISMAWLTCRIRRVMLSKLNVVLWFHWIVLLIICWRWCVFVIVITEEPTHNVYLAEFILSSIIWVCISIHRLINYHN